MRSFKSLIQAIAVCLLGTVQAYSQQPGPGPVPIPITMNGNNSVLFWGVTSTLQNSVDLTLSGSHGQDSGFTGFLANQAFRGTTTFTGDMGLNFLSATNILNAPSAEIDTLRVNQSLGASSIGGQFTAVSAVINQTAATGNKTAGVAQTEMVPLQSTMFASHSEGGTGTGFAQGYGVAEGANSNIALLSGATNMYGIFGYEADIAAGTGSSLGYKAGMMIVLAPNDRVQGTQLDAGLDFVSSFGGGGNIPGWTYGIAFGKNDGYWPISSTGTIIGTNAVAAGSVTAAHGTDYSAVTFSTDAFKSTGFAVQPNGSINLSAATVTGSPGSNAAQIGTSTTSGLVLAGNGSTFDVLLQNSANGVGCQLGHAGSIFQCGRLGPTSATVSGNNFNLPASNTVGVTANSVQAMTWTSATTTALGAINAPNLATSSAATTGTLCWTTVTGLVNVDTTVACLASDERLKNILGAPSGSLATIMALQPILYSWKSDSPRAGDVGEHIGLGAFATGYADEKLIARDADGNPRGWRQDAVVATLVGAVQEQQHEIAMLRWVGGVLVLILFLLVGDLYRRVQMRQLIQLPSL